MAGHRSRPTPCLVALLPSVQVFLPREQLYAWPVRRAARSRASVAGRGAFPVPSAWLGPPLGAAVGQGSRPRSCTPPCR